MPELSVELPLPPPDNALHMSGQYCRYATKAYKEWLTICRPILKDAIGGREPDTERWWVVTLGFYMPARGDMPNREKAALDLLAGSSVCEDKGKDKGKIVKAGDGFFDDDCRVTRVVKDWVEIGTPVDEARVRIVVHEGEPPCRFVKPKKVKA